MDANGTRYHLMLGAADWARAVTEPLGAAEYDPDREDYRLRPLAFRAPTRLGDRLPRLEDRRGAECDAFGNLYWIDTGADHIRVQSSGSGATSVFWAGEDPGCTPGRASGAFGPVPDAPAATTACPLRLSGLTVTRDHYLVVGTLAPAGLLVFDLHAPGPPRQALWPQDVPFAPFDLCPRPRGGAFVLDADNRTLWELDERFLVVTRRPHHDPPAPGDFEPVSGAATPPPPEPEWRAHLRVDAADGLALGGDPIAVVAAHDGVLLLDRPAGATSTVRLLAPGVDGAPQATLQQLDSEGSVRFAMTGYDMALLPGDGLGVLYVAERDGNQAFAFRLALEEGRLTAALLEDHFPMRLFGGKGLVAGPTSAMYDFGNGWVPLVHQSRPRHEADALVYLPAFDGREPGTVWHRLLLDACIPPETAVAVETRAADEHDELAAAAWVPEPALAYRRGDGSELAFAPATPGYDTWELLFQRARGRYLQIRLLLSGDGRSTPRLRALRAYYPRFSYLEHYLPDVYREEPESSSFLDRYLANAEGLLTSLEDRMAAAQVLLDADTAPAEAIDWLLGWFEFAADPTWGEQRRRLFLRHAVEFFRLRGTVPGLRMALRLALDPRDEEDLFDPQAVDCTSRIVERYRIRRTPPVVLGDPTTEAGPAVVPRTALWEPAHGGEALQERWRQAAGEGAGGFPLAAWGDASWRAFLRTHLGVEPAGPFEARLWTDFLAERYGRIDALDAAYGLVAPGDRHASFTAAAYPDTLPADGAPLRDWYHFLTLVLPARRAAHRFTVLLPMPAAGDDAWSAAERRAIAERVVEMQKPAHTTFDVKYFWAAFRLGEVRLGEDTLLDLGSRDPRLRQPVVLGREHAGESFLGHRRWET